MLHLNNGILFNHSKVWNNVIFSNMDGSRNYHAEWSKSGREGKILYGIPYMWNLEGNDTSQLIYKIATDSQT